MSRKVIRQYITNRLKPSTGASNRVFDTKVAPYFASDIFPQIAVYTPKEETQDQISKSAPITYRVILEVEIHLFVARRLPANLTVDEVTTLLAGDLDDLDDQVQARMDYNLGGNAISCLYDGFECDFNIEGERPMGMGKMKYKVEYHRTEPVPTADDDFDSLWVAWDMADLAVDIEEGGPDGQIDAEDRIENLSI